MGLGWHLLVRKCKFMDQGTRRVRADPGSKPSPDPALRLLKKGFSLPFSLWAPLKLRIVNISPNNLACFLDE